MARWQLLELGLTPDWIRVRVRGGRLHRLYRGVYAVGHTNLSVAGRRMAAVLSCGRVAFLSHRTAAAHWNLLRGGGRIHVTIAATGRRPRRDGVLLHESGDVAGFSTVHDGIPVTTVARTLLDLAADRDPLLERAIEEAELLGLFDLTEVDAVMASPRPGVRRLGHALRIYRSVPEARSLLERRVLKAIRAAGLPEPALNVWVLGAERDMVWWEQRVVVELDGPSHATTAARIRDPQRDAALELRDWRVLRVAQPWFDTDPAGVIATIRDYLSAPRRSS